jgi:energy-coupling factor transporter ATP-binding protein EcfA2
VAETISSIPLKKPAFVRNLPLIVANVKPELASGMYTIDTIDGPKKAFNLFRQSRALSILNNPDLYLQYKRPDNMLQFLESLIPDNDIREYVIRFIKTKLTTFGYSPVVLYFLGISGSGKDTFVELLNKILGEEYAYLAKPTADHFVEKHNGWMKDIFFAHLDEFGNQLSSLADKNEALGKIKTYTGSPYVQIREMRSDSTPRKHSVTFIMTANKNPLILDAEDRRFVIIKTPNILKEEEWVQANGGMSVTRDKMWGELNDFCYYLATEVKSLSSDEYTAPPNNPDKLGLIADMLNPVDYVVFCLMHGMVDRIKQIIEIAHYYPFTVLRTDSVYESRLRALVDAYDPEAYSIKYLNASLRKYNIKKIPTTLDGDRDNHCVFSVPVEFRKAVDFEVTQPIL